MEYDAFLELVQNRRSVRRFKPEDVPDEYIDRIIEAARWAPSGYNTQPWEFVVVRDKKLKDEIARRAVEYAKLMGQMEDVREPWQRVTRHPWKNTEADYRLAPVFILLLGDTRTQKGLPAPVRYDADCRRRIFISSLANAFLYMTMAVTTLGLACQWVSATAMPYPQCFIKDLLGIPAELEIYDMLAVGYGAQRPRTKFMRDAAKMVHHDYCGEDDFRTDAEVNDYLKRTRTWVTANHRWGVDK